MSAGISTADVLARIAISRRYRWVADAVVERLAAEEIPKSRNLADAEKRTKRRLHQIFGAYTGQPDYARLLLDIGTAASKGDDGALRPACSAAMTLHASTRERLPILDTFYERIFAVTGVPERLVDLACGLNPVALPWMQLPTGCHYTASDIDTQMIGFVDGFLDLMEVDHVAGVHDIVASPVDLECDVALLLKSIPCLDQQDPDCALRAIQEIRARHVVLSFPTQSLGGRSHGQGMARNYRTRFATMLDNLGWSPSQATEIEFPGELAFIVAKP